MRIDFLIELVRRRIIDRYVGTSSRLFWVLVAPGVPILTSLAVFYYIARVPEIQSMGLAPYAAFMFSGFLPFQIVQKSTRESCDLLILNMDMLKTAVFPLPFLSMAAVGALLVEFLIQCALMAVLLVFAQHALTWTIVLLPVAVLMLFSLALGMSWLLSIFSFALRDLQEIVGVLFMALLYVTPIMYPPEAAPSALQTLIWLNPLTSYVIVFRDVILPDQGGLHVAAWVVAGSISVVILGIGWNIIRAAQRYVGDLV